MYDSLTFQSVHIFYICNVKGPLGTGIEKSSIHAFRHSSRYFCAFLYIAFIHFHEYNKQMESQKTGLMCIMHVKAL